VKTSQSKYCKCLYFSANALARKVEKLADESWKKVGLSPSHAYLLMLVLDEPGIHPTALCEQLQLQPSTITRLIEKLEVKGMVVRTSKGKATSVFPTQKGKSMYKALKECLMTFYETYSQILGKAESAQFVAAINTVADCL